VAVAEGGGAGATEWTGLAETTGDGAAEALTAGVCAQRAVGHISTSSVPRHRKQSPQTRADVEELIEVLTLGPESFGHRDLNCKHNCRAMGRKVSWKGSRMPTSSPAIALEPVAKFQARE